MLASFQVETRLKAFNDLLPGVVPNIYSVSHRKVCGKTVFACSLAQCVRAWRCIYLLRNILRSRICTV